jgi:hypothetical protein
MNRGRSLITALIVMLLAPLPLLAQQGGGQGRGMGGGMGGARLLLEQGSVEFLVTKAADLKLTDEQSAGLKAIGEKWAEATKEERTKIRAELPQPGRGAGAGGDRQAMMQRLQAVQPLMEKVRAEDEKAVAEALKLLDETQQASAKKILEERRPPQPPRGR